MKIVLFILTLLITFKKAISQPLSIGETINYINGYISNQQGQFNSENISLDSEGKFTIKTKYKNSEVSEYFYVQDIFGYKSTLSPEKTSLFNECGIMWLNCLSGSCITWIDNDNTHYFQRPDSYTQNKKGFKEKTGLPTIYAESYVQQKICNAYRYLFTKILEAGTYYRKDTDPFAPNNLTNIKENDVQKIPNTSNTIKLIKSDNIFTLNIKIGTVSKMFIFDSGASEVNITEELEKQLIAEGIITQSDYLAKGLYKIASGEIHECRRVNIKSIKIGQFTITNVKASISNNESPLLLGKSILDRFKKWSIDNEKLLLTLEK